MGARLLVALESHVGRHRWLYLLVAGCFIGGLVAGALMAGGLQAMEAGELSSYLDNFLRGFSDRLPDINTFARQATMRNLELMLLLWFLGLTVVGAPLVLGVVFLRGIVLGFTVGFLVQQKALGGLLLAVTAVLPHNMLAVPALLVGSVGAVAFSGWLVSGRRRQEGLLLPLLSYTMLILVASVVVGGAALVEAYVSPAMLRMLAGYL